MVKHIFVAAVFAALTAGAAVPTILKVQSQSVRYPISRDYKTIPGSVITTWYRDGRPDYLKPAVETNVIRSITGKVMNTALEDELAQARVRIQELLANVQTAQSNLVLAVQNAAAEKAATRQKLIDYGNNARLSTTRLLCEQLADLLFPQ